MNTLRIRNELERMARDEQERQELEAAARADTIIGVVCVVGLALFIFIDIVWRI